MAHGQTSKQARIHKTRHKSRGCLHKVRHETLLAARARGRRLGGPARVSAYLCEFCGGYHVGH